MWTKSLEYIKDFSFNICDEFFKKNGSTQRQESKGYKYFIEGFIHDVWIDDLTLAVKGKCYRSQKKNEKAHNLNILFEKNTNGELCVNDCKCSCEIGLSRSCHHVRGLAYYLQDLLYRGIRTVPEDASKTSQPMTWNKPRGRKIMPESLHMMTFYKPTKITRKKNGISSHYFQPNVNVEEKDSKEDKIRKMMVSLNNINPAIPFSYLVNLIDQDETWTTIGIQQPQNQESTEPQAQPERQPVESFPALPHLDNEAVNILISLPAIDVEPCPKTLEEAWEIERKTRNQATSQLWHEYRTLRFTASHFGELCKRRKAFNSDYFNKLWANHDLTHIPSIRHGIKFESEAKIAYECATGNKVQQTGLVIHPYSPHLAASPDGIVFETTSGSYGLLEIKCPYSQKCSTLEEAVNMKTFCLKLNENNVPTLKCNHNYYYQVQGQLLITGYKWCDFCVYFHKNKQIFIERIERDVDFAMDMYTRLTSTYNIYKNLRQSS